jgi:hypothetical protein
MDKYINNATNVLFASQITSLVFLNHNLED